MQTLQMGGVNIKMQDWCHSLGTVTSDDGSIVTAWNCNGEPQINKETVFELKSAKGLPKFLKNMHPTVQINGGEFKFRNPPHFLGFIEQDTRDAIYEMEAVIAHSKVWQFKSLSAIYQCCGARIQRRHLCLAERGGINIFWNRGTWRFGCHNCCCFAGLRKEVSSFKCRFFYWISPQTSSEAYRFPSVYGIHTKP